MEQFSYESLGAGIGRLVEEKQRAYGRSFNKTGEILRILFPDGIRPDQYDDALFITRVLDKMFRIATDRDALGESPARDITGYGLLMTEHHDRLREGVKGQAEKEEAEKVYPVEEGSVLYSWSTREGQHMFRIIAGHESYRLDIQSGGEWEGVLDIPITLGFPGVVGRG